MVIEASLRLATQFLDFYGHGWFDSVGLYEHRAWEAPGPASPAGTSLVLRLTQDEGSAGSG